MTYAPKASKIKGVSVPPVETAEDMFRLPDVNENIEVPNGTPGSGILPYLSMPSPTTGSKIDAGSLHMPSPTDVVE